MAQPPRLNQGGESFSFLSLFLFTISTARQENIMKRTAQEIAEHVGGEIRGDARTVIDSIASLKNAGPSDLSYADEKSHDEVAASRAGCVFVRSGEWPSRTVILV